MRNLEIRKLTSDESLHIPESLLKVAPFKSDSGMCSDSSLVNLRISRFLMDGNCFVKIGFQRRDWEVLEQVAQERRFVPEERDEKGIPNQIAREA